MLPWLSLIAVVVIGLLAWDLRKRFGADRIEVLSEKRRATSRYVTRGEFVDGNRHVDVVLALSQSTFFYENSGIQGSLDLQWVREIEYDTRLATGHAMAAGKVLRLRSNSQTFEFVIANDDVAKWHTMMPARRAADSIASAG